MVSARKFAHTTESPIVVIDAPTDGTDATAIINAQIAAAPDGSTIQFPVGQSQGKYRCDFPLIFDARRDLTIEGPVVSNTQPDTGPAVIYTDLKMDKTLHPQMFIGTNSQRQHIRVSNCTNITFRRMRVEGPNTLVDSKGYTKIQPPWEAEHAFFFPGSTGIVLEDCEAERVYGDGAFLGAGSTHLGPSFITIRRFKVRLCGRAAVGLTRCSNVLLDGVVSERAGTGAISFEPNGGSEYVRGVEVRNGHYDSRMPLMPAHGVQAIDDVWIHHNTFADCGNAKSWPLIVCEPKSAITTIRSHRWRVEDNDLGFVGTGGAYTFYEVDDIIVARNTMTLLGPFRAAVRLTKCGGDIQITDNDFGRCQNLMELIETATPVHHGNTWASGTQTDG